MRAHFRFAALLHTDGEIADLGGEEDSAVLAGGLLQAADLGKILTCRCTSAS